MKRRREEAGAEKKLVTYDTYKKWRIEYDRECSTMSWLDCETTTAANGKRVVNKLKCKVCSRFKDKISGRKNFSNKWIVGAESIRTSNVRDHSRNDQHVHAMMLLNKEHSQSSGLGPQSYAPIAKALNRLPDDERERLKRKFDIAYFVASENLPYTKYPKICDLEARHGVQVGSAYRNENAGKEFVHYIAKSKREAQLQKLAVAKFFSLLLDASTDKGNVDNELLLAVWCDPNGSDEKIHTRMDYLTVNRPHNVTAKGLFEVLEGGLVSLGISEVSAEACKKLVGVGTDGAASNIAAAGLKGQVEGRLSWVFWMWCLAHRLELAVKDALNDTRFSLIDEMLLKLYYLYEKSPKKCRELEDIISDLQQYMAFDDCGVRPVRASGTRWVAHKLNAMKRVLSKYGAYTSHLAALSTDSSVKAVDCAKLSGFYKKWTDAKYVLGCALFIDLLTPCAIFSKSMQSDEADILGAMTCLLKTLKETERLSSTPLESWPTYAATLSKCIEEEEDKMVYQCQELTRFSQAVEYYTNHYRDFCSQIVHCIKSRLSWSDLDLIRDIIFVLSTHGWEKAMLEEDMSAVERLVERFTVPLQGAEADIDAMVTEFREMISYATQYIALSVLDYRSVWWKLFHAPNSSEWPNILILAELLFSLPASNGKLERVFSTLGLIKGDRRTRLTNESLDDLLVLSTEKVPLQMFDPNPSIELWWSEKDRRPSQTTRRQYKSRQSTSRGTNTEEIETEDGSESVDLLRDWDDLIGADDD